MEKNFSKEIVGCIGLMIEDDLLEEDIVAGISRLDASVVTVGGWGPDRYAVDLLEYFTGSDRVSVIAGIWTEALCRRAGFIDAAAKAALHKPLVILRRKTGKQKRPMPGGVEGEFEESLFKYGSAIEARDLSHFVALAGAFSKQPLPNGNDAFIVSFAGVPAIPAANKIRSAGMRLAVLDAYCQNRLRKDLACYPIVGNLMSCPVDMPPIHIKSLLEGAAQSTGVSCFIIVASSEKTDVLAGVLETVNFKNKPVVCCLTGRKVAEKDLLAMEKTGIPIFDSIEAAAEVLSQMYQYVLRRRAVEEYKPLGCAFDTIAVDDVPVSLRLIEARDKGLWTDFVNSCSEESLWLRFLSPFRPTPERAERFCNVDPDEEIAVVAEIKLPDRSKFLGIARLIENKRRKGELEYAIIVSDQWQNKRLGYVMSKRCFDLAREKGFKTVRAETVQTNFPMIRIFRRCNFRFDGKDENMISTSLSLS